MTEPQQKPWRHGTPCFRIHSVLPYPFRTSVVAQGTIEYLLVLVAILLAMLFAVRTGGPVQSAVDTLLSDVADVISKAVTDAKGRLGL